MIYFYEAKKELDKAEEYGLYALKLREEHFGVYHVDYGQVCNHLANIYLRLGKMEEALKYYKHAREVYLVELGEDHALLSRVLHNYGICCLLSKDIEEAKKHLLQSVDIKRIAYGENHNHTQRTLTVLNRMESETIDHKTIELDF